jgi:hypothetical protein
MDNPATARSWHQPKDMTTDDITACYELAIRIMQHEPDYEVDSALGKWLDRARAELRARSELHQITGLLPVYCARSFKMRMKVSSVVSMCGCE